MVLVTHQLQFAQLADNILSIKNVREWLVMERSDEIKGNWYSFMGILLGSRADR